MRRRDSQAAAERGQPVPVAALLPESPPRYRFAAPTASAMRSSYKDMLKSMLSGLGDD